MLEFLITVLSFSFSEYDFEPSSNTKHRCPSFEATVTHSK